MCADPLGPAAGRWKAEHHHAAAVRVLGGGRQSEPGTGFKVAQAEVSGERGSLSLLQECLLITKKEVVTL